MSIYGTGGSTHTLRLEAKQQQLVAGQLPAYHHRVERKHFGGIVNPHRITQLIDYPKHGTPTGQVKHAAYQPTNLYPTRLCQATVATAK